MSEAEEVLNLARAREILLMEAVTAMPSGAVNQRGDVVRALEEVVAKTLARHPQLKFADSAGDEVTQKALKWLKNAPPAASPSSNRDAYNKLKDAFAESSHLGQASAILEWVRLTQSKTCLRKLPYFDETLLEGCEAALKVAAYRAVTRPEIKGWLAAAHAQDGLLPDEKRNLQLMQREWRLQAGLDAALINELNRAGNQCFAAWQQAKAHNDFASLAPSLQKVTDLTRRKAEILAEEDKVTLYDAMLDQYSPGLSNETVTKVFAELKSKLPAFIHDIAQKQKQQSTPIALPSVPTDVQARIANALMKELGLDENHSRLDISDHPFSTGDWDDVRITTRYDENDLLSGLYSVIHEAGHALYSRGLPQQWHGQPIGSAQGMAIHESQSLMWEKQIALSPEFMVFLSGFLKKQFRAEKLDIPAAALEPQNLFKLRTHVEPSLIRVDADEVTYPMHVVLRHDLEQKLLDGTLAVKDLPAAWNKGMKELLAIDVPNDTQGCMQDIHWTDGSIGYFPAYTFGALGAAQLMQAIRKAIPDVGKQIEAGEFGKIREWLKINVHQKGSSLSSEDIIEKATGKPLSAQAWLEHVQSRYLGPSPFAAKHGGLGDGGNAR